MGGFQKAFSLLFPKHRRFDIEDLSTGLLQRVAEAGDVTCEKFIAMYLEAQAAGLTGTQRWILFSLKKLPRRKSSNHPFFMGRAVSFEECI